MSIRAFFAAIIFTVGLGGAASAATVYNISMKLKYEGTFYTDGQVYFYEPDADGNERGFEFDRYLADGNALGIPVLNEKLKIGKNTKFSAEVSVPDEPSECLDYYCYDNGGRTENCIIAGVDCGYVSTVYLNDQLSFGIDGSSYSSLSSGLKAGQSLSYTFNLGYFSSLDIDGGGVNFFNRTARFTLLKDAKIVPLRERTLAATFDPAPVPLPATAALLPLGIGALAMMRKRRRS